MVGVWSLIFTSCNSLSAMLICTSLPRKAFFWLNSLSEASVKRRRLLKSIKYGAVDARMKEIFIFMLSRTDEMYVRSSGKFNKKGKTNQALKLLTWDELYIEYGTRKRIVWSQVSKKWELVRSWVIFLFWRLCKQGIGYSMDGESVGRVIILFVSSQYYTIYTFFQSFPPASRNLFPSTI